MLCLFFGQIHAVEVQQGVRVSWLVHWTGLDSGPGLHDLHPHGGCHQDHPIRWAAHRGGWSLRWSGKLMGSGVLCLVENKLMVVSHTTALIQDTKNIQSLDSQKYYTIYNLKMYCENITGKFKHCNYVCQFKKFNMNWKIYNLSIILPPPPPAPQRIKAVCSSRAWRGQLSPCGPPRPPRTGPSLWTPMETRASRWRPPPIPS